MRAERGQSLRRERPWSGHDLSVSLMLLALTMRTEVEFSQRASRPDSQPSPSSSMVPKGMAIKNNSMSVVEARAKSYI